MNVIIFGSTGMLGQGVLRECLLDPAIGRVLTVGRKPTGQANAKLRQLAVPNLNDLSAIQSEFDGFDACFFCLGVTSNGTDEAEYKRITHDIAVEAGQTLLRANARAKFVLISGAGADRTETSKTMWARVKGATENAIFNMPFAAAFVIRPTVVQPLHGIKSRTASYRIFYTLLGPLLPVVKALFPSSMTTTERLGRAMINIVTHGYAKATLETRDVNDAAKFQARR